MKISIIRKKISVLLNVIFVLNLSLLWFFSPYWKHGCKVVFFWGLLWWFLKNVFEYGINFWKHFFIFNKYTKILFLFLGVVGVSYYFSKYPGLSREYFFERYLWYVIVFLWGMSLKKEHRVLFLFVGLLAGLVFGIGSFVDILHGKFCQNHRVWSSFGIYPDMATHIGIYLMLGLGMLLCGDFKKIRWFIFLEVFSLLPIFFMHKSRSLWLSFISVIFIFGWIRKRMKSAGLVLVGFFVMILLLGLGARFKTGLNLKYGGDRVAMWKADLDIMRRNTIFGTGPGTNEKVLQSYARKFAEEKHYHSHEAYLEMGADIGLAGLSVFMLFIFFIFRDTIFMLRKKIKQKTGNDLLSPLFLILFTMLIFAFSSTTFIVGVQTSLIFWICIGVTAGILVENNSKNYIRRES